MTTIIAQQDPWREYDHPGKGKGKWHPHVPESASYGFALIVLLSVAAIWMKKRRF